MGRRERQDDRGAQHARDEQQIQDLRKNHDSYCPRCRVWYPTTSTAHEGH